LKAEKMQLNLLECNLLELQEGSNLHKKKSCPFQPSFCNYNATDFQTYYICDCDICNPMCPCSCKYMPLHVRLNDGSNQLLVEYRVVWYNYKSFKLKCKWNFNIFCSFFLVCPFMDDNWIAWWQQLWIFYNYQQYKLLIVSN